MIDLPAPTENRIIQAARDNGLTIAEILDGLLKPINLTGKRLQKLQLP